MTGGCGDNSSRIHALTIWSLSTVRKKTMHRLGRSGSILWVIDGTWYLMLMVTRWGAVWGIVGFKFSRRKATSARSALSGGRGRGSDAHRTTARIRIRCTAPPPGADGRTIAPGYDRHSRRARYFFLLSSPSQAEVVDSHYQNPWSQICVLPMLGFVLNTAGSGITGLLLGDNKSERTRHASVLGARGGTASDVSATTVSRSATPDVAHGEHLQSALRSGGPGDGVCGFHLVSDPQ